MRKRRLKRQRTRTWTRMNWSRVAVIQSSCWRMIPSLVQPYNRTPSCYVARTVLVPPQCPLPLVSSYHTTLCPICSTASRDSTSALHPTVTIPSYYQSEGAIQPETKYLGGFRCFFFEFPKRMTGEWRGGAEQKQWKQTR